jgi:hypothetical protein
MKQGETNVGKLILFGLEKVVGFLKNVQPLYSGAKSKPCKLTASGHMHTCILFFNPEDGGNTFLQNICKLPPGYMKSHCTVRLKFQSNCKNVHMFDNKVSQ